MVFFSHVETQTMENQQPTTSNAYFQEFNERENKAVPKPNPFFVVKPRKVMKLAKPKTSDDYFANFKRYRVQRVRKEVLDKLDLQKIRHDVLCEFFEVAIHNVLFYRELYPASLFERMKKQVYLK